MGYVLRGGGSLRRVGEEGVLAAQAVHEVAKKLDIEMPICHQVYRILYEGASAREAVGALMRRDLKSEH